MKKQFQSLIMLMFLFTFFFGKEGFALTNYAKRSATKLGRGVTNIIFCPRDLWKAVERSIEEGKTYEIFPISPIKGVFWTLGRLFVGVYEVTTFWVPQEPIIKPVYFTPSIKEYYKEDYRGE